MVTDKVNDQVRLGYGKSGPRRCDVVLSPGEGKEEAEEGLCWKGVISPQHSSSHGCSSQRVAEGFSLG